MADSPLFGALTNSNPSLIPNDPAYMPVARRLALAQALMGKGVDASPAYPLQGLARVVQAGLGSWLQGKGESDFADVQKAQQGDYMNALRGMEGPGATLGAAMTTQAAPPMPPKAQTDMPAPVVTSPMAPIVDRAAAQSGVPATQLAAMIAKESGGNPNAVNPQSGAAGAPQILASTATQPGYGVHPIAPEDRTNPEKAIPFAADYVAARAKAAGLDMTQPDQAAKAWSLYGGDSSGAYGKSVVANAGNVATDANAGGAAPQPGAGTTQPGAPQTGMNAPNVRQALDEMDRARQNYEQYALKHPYDTAGLTRLSAIAQMHAQHAQALMGLDNVVPDTRNGVAGQTELRSGKFTPYFTAASRLGQDAHGNTLVAEPGGGVRVISNNPSGFSGNTPEANAMRTIAELGPKIANGTATPQEHANYATAATVFQNPEVLRNSAGQLERVQKTSLPSGAPPGGVGAESGSTAPGVTTLTPGTPPTEAITKRYEEFQTAGKTALGARDELQQAALLKQTLHELGSTGPATPFLANLSRYAAQIGVPEDTIKKFGLPPGASETDAAALANALVMEIARAGFPQRITNNDLQFAQSVKPNPSMPLASADFLIDNTVVPRAQRDIERYGAVVNLTNPKHPEYDPSLGSMHSKMFEYDQQHPLSSYTPRLQNPPAAQGAQQGAAALPVMKTPEEAAKLPKGTHFIDPNGQRRVVP